MKRILLQVPSPHLANDAMFKNTDINNHFIVWKELKRRLAEIGYDLVTAEDIPVKDAAFFIFLDSLSIDNTRTLYQRSKSVIKKLLNREDKNTWPKRKLYSELREKNMLDRAVLLLWEGKSINPLNYHKSTWDKFKYILTWDDDLVDNKKFFKFFLPVPFRSPIQNSIPFSSKKLLVNITANKYSYNSNELYSARRETIRYFTKNHPSDFDLFGVKWDKPATIWQERLPFLVEKYPNYRGASQDKIGTLSKYKFTLAYENMNKTNGYITEKLFDALLAKTVPIYWGAENIGEYISPKAFIDRRAFKNDAELASYLVTVNEEKYAEMLEAGQEYLRSEKFSKFLPGHFCDQIINVLTLKPII